MKARRWIVALTLFAACNRNRGGSSAPDATARTRADATTETSDVRDTQPENLLLTIRGITLRRALPLLFAQNGGAEVVEQLSRQVTPGIADHGDEIDVDNSFAVAGSVGGEDGATLVLHVAWPLRPGMQIAQDARERRGWRVVSEGLYAPTSPDAGADAESQCWVARREPVGWMLLCGPRASLPQFAGFLRRQANAPVEQNLSLEMDVHPQLIGRVLRRQLTELDGRAPPQNDPRRNAFDEARRSARLYSALANDIESLRLSVTQDDSNLHVRASATIPRPTSDETRAIIAAGAGRQANADLVHSLPASAQGWIAGAFDRVEMERATGAQAADPMLAAQGGPEVARVFAMVESVKNATAWGVRVDSYSNEDGYTMYHVVRRADAQQFVNDLRVAINSIPARSLPDGGNLRDLAVAMPTPGLPGLNVLRVGRNVNIPPGAQVPPEIRAAIERSMLLVAEGDRLTAVMGRDPIARYRAMSQGARLATAVPPNSVMAGHVTPPSFAPLFYGSSIPGLQVTQTSEGVDFSVGIERAGEGARIELRADAPIPAGLEIRGLYAAIQELQQRMLQQMLEQQRRAQQGGGGPGGPGGRPMMMPRPQRPQLDPSMLPEPPRLQLQPPQ